MASFKTHSSPTGVLLHHCCSNLPSTKVGRQIISGAPVSIPYSGGIKVSQLWYPSNRRFNSLDISCLLRHFCLQQIMKEHTRKDTTLDLILTNMHDHYFPPQPFVPLRLSNHNVVVATPLHGKRHLPTSP